MAVLSLELGLWFKGLRVEFSELVFYFWNSCVVFMRWISGIVVWVEAAKRFQGPVP